MKNRASTFFKQILSVLGTVVKAKSLALKSKTNAMKTRLILFSLMKNKKVLMDTISHKIHALLGQQNRGREQNEDISDQSKAIVLYSTTANESYYPNPSCTELVDEMVVDGVEDDKYPDLTHSLFDSDGEDLELDDQTGSVIDLVKNSKEEEGEDFVLEDEIDHVADLFIRRFHRQMKMQKLASFKRYQDMMDRSV